MHKLLKMTGIVVVLSLLMPPHSPPRTALASDPPPPTGACIVDETCLNLTGADCTVVDGLYFGDGSFCFPSLTSPAKGVCCLGEGKVLWDVNRAQCRSEDWGNIFLQGDYVPTVDETPCDLLPGGD